MFTFSINGGLTKPLSSGGFRTLEFQGVMRQAGGMIGRMPFTLGGAMELVSLPAIPTVFSPVNITSPVVTTDGAVSGNAPNGPATAGDLLTTTDGTWHNAPPSFTYRWHGGNALTNPTNTNAYFVNAADVGPISCEVTATNSHGSASQNGNSIALE